MSILKLVRITVDCSWLLKTQSLFSAEAFVSVWNWVAGTRAVVGQGPAGAGWEWNLRSNFISQPRLPAHAQLLPVYPLLIFILTQKPLRRRVEIDSKGLFIWGGIARLTRMMLCRDLTSYSIIIYFQVCVHMEYEPAQLGRIPVKWDKNFPYERKWSVLSR